MNARYKYIIQAIYNKFRKMKFDTGKYIFFFFFFFGGGFFNIKKKVCFDIFLLFNII